MFSLVKGGKEVSKIGMYGAARRAGLGASGAGRAGGWRELRVPTLVS
jgi:hypothetical protein